MNFFGPKEQRELDLARARGEEIPDLSDEERGIIDRKRAALEKLLDYDEIFATYKLEMTFGSERRTNSHFPGSITIWLSGSALGGGGDEIVYTCPDDKCPGIILPDLISTSARKAGCPKCQKIWRQDQLSDMRLFRLNHQQWATVIARYFIRLNHDADLYYKANPLDIINPTLQEQVNFKGGELMNKAIMSRVPVMYPLANLYKDLSAGADLEKRILAFITA